MKKLSEKLFPIASGIGTRLFIMARLCVLLLVCATASLSAVPAAVSYNDYPGSPVKELNASDEIQQLTVRGTITDASTGDPLPGVTVMVKGTTVGTLSDMNGRFSVNVPDRNAVLSFSFVGFTTQELPAVIGKDMNVQMALEVTQISEVVVVGYGVQKKESVVGAITQVNSATLMRGANINVTNAITGKLSGVLTIQQTGEPGADQSEIIIRGLSSWNGSQPLVLVDGVERDFKDLDPNEINTLSVLKDASATAVFGAKGANGVIIVTTKRGSLGKPKMDFSASYGMEKATRMADHISSYTTMSMLNVANSNNQNWTDLVPENVLEQYRNPSSPLKALQYPDVNWFNLLTKPFAATYNANFNISGGTNFIKYFTSLAYFHQGDYFKSYRDGYDDTRYYYNRFNYRANIDFNLTESTLLSLNLGGELGIKNQPSGTPWRMLYQASTSRFPAYFPAWVLEQVPDTDYPDASGKRYAVNFDDFIGNPYSYFNQGSFNRYNASKLFTDLILNQKLDFITKGLSAQGKVSLSTYYQNLALTTSYSFPEYQIDYAKIGVDANNDGKVDQNPWFRYGQSDATYQLPLLNINVGGMSGGYYTDFYYEMSLNYSNTFGKHTVTGLALMNRQQKNAEVAFPYYNEALVGRGTYDYDHKYLVEVNIGYTGSERFAPGNRFGFFPSGALGWVVSEEDFFKEAVPWMSKLKFRYSDGLVGSDYAANRWLFVSEYYKDNRGYIHEDKGANTTAQWEEARKRDLGVEIGLLKDMFTLSVDLFDEKRDKMLLEPLSVTMLVGNSFKDLNLGRMKKHGIEIESEFRKTTSQGLTYYVKGIFGFNENRILFKDDPVYAPDYTKQAGKPLGAQINGVKLTGTGYYTSVNDIHNNVAPIPVEKINVGDYKFLDYKVDGVISILDKYPIKGSLYPPITYSLSSGFVYKNFEFNMMFAGNVGKYVVFNQTYEVEFVKGVRRVHVSQLDYWRPDNQNAAHSTLHYSGQGNADILYWAGGSGDAGYECMIENRFWRNADYLRLKELNVAYSIKSDFLAKTAKISGLQVYAAGTNLWTLTDLIEGDPERKDFQQGFYPQMTSVKFGVKMSF
jgi:TonB-linked SusC/RagA family outer membrane protein